MTSKERVLLSLERKETDRVPLALSCGGPNSAINTLLEHYRAENSDELMSTMGIDLRSVAPRYVGPDGMAPIGTEGGEATVFGGSEYVSCDFDGSGGIAGTYADDVGLRPFQNFESVAEIESYVWPDIDWFDFSHLKSECAGYSDFFVRCGGWSPMLSRVFELFGMEKALTNLYDRPDLARATIEMSVDWYYKFYEKALQAADGGIDIIGFGDDVATQRDLLVDPAMWRDLCKEPLARLFELGKKYDAYVYFHSCGAVRDIMDDLVEIGMNILFPVQPRATGMDHRGLKKRYGESLAFWGGIDVQHILPFGKPDEVRRYVRDRIDVLGDGGGYILSSSHNLLKAFPLQNILAMYDEATLLETQRRF